jgi:hypothetical protein
MIILLGVILQRAAVSSVRPLMALHRILFSSFLFAFWRDSNIFMPPFFVHDHLCC